MTIPQFVQLAIEEDIKKGDHSALACIPVTALGEAQLLVKEDGIIAGIEIAKQIFKEFDTSFEFEQYLNDGDNVKKGEIAFKVHGPSQTLLGAERLVLNVMQRMSAIATLTNKYVKALEGLPTKVLDTRKTTPLIRFLEKEAVTIGGGHNHRMGLYDMIMLKDNHIDFAGGIEDAINQHPMVAESAIVGFSHPIKGNALYGFISLKPNLTKLELENIKTEINIQIGKQIGPIAKLDKIQITAGLPKTRSGKIMRRILRKIANNDSSNLGDISTLLNPEVVESIKNNSI